MKEIAAEEVAKPRVALKNLNMSLPVESSQLSSEIHKKNKVSHSPKWSLVIKPKYSLFDLHLKDLWRYRDLLFMFVKRDFAAIYKQTILGPLWFLIQPLLSTLMFMIIFNKVAGIPTEGIPSPIFYLSGLIVWNYFAACLNNTAVTFSANASIFGKVYFPRMIVPLSNVISALVGFGIQLFILIVLTAYYYFFTPMDLQLNALVLLIPFLLFLVASLGLGLGLIVSSLTTKYRDLTFLISFGVQLLMYATPVIYPLSFIKGKYRMFILANPITPIIESFRYAFLGVGEFNAGHLLYSVGFTAFVLFLGVIIFNRVEKSFMDVI